MPGSAQNSVHGGEGGAEDFSLKLKAGDKKLWLGWEIQGGEGSGQKGRGVEGEAPQEERSRVR